ncbi:MAG: sigma-70 family RNA polymerase sigma factor [Chloroflexi bacterium]|nr:sigma-70 family RNA polymerase sigma factor [Chloroflexota bacterium]MCL5105029.1 sigma-70 family RNA polymerase sigma factor [Armatimonadota bacterium]
MDFDGLVDAYQKPIFNLVFRLLGDKDEAADVTQETFVAAYKSFSDFRGESSAYTWLYRIAVNKCKNRFKQAGRRKKHESQWLETDENPESVVPLNLHAGSEYNPDAVLQRREMRERIARAITQLPPDYRIVEVLRDVQGLSYEEVAKAADLSVDVVRTRIARARRMLREKLAPYFSEE